VGGGPAGLRCDAILCAEVGESPAPELVGRPPDHREAARIATWALSAAVWKTARSGGR
jgi:hypothetical protein